MSCYDILAQKTQDPFGQTLYDESVSSLPLSIVDCLIDLYPSKNFLDAYVCVEQDLQKHRTWHERFYLTILELFPHLVEYSKEDLVDLGLTLLKLVVDVIDVENVTDDDVNMIVASSDPKLGRSAIEDYIRLYIVKSSNE